MIDLVTSPIDAAKEFITAQYFTEKPSDAALLDFSKQFSVAISGEYATVHHPLANLTASIRVVIDVARPDTPAKKRVITLHF